MGAIMHTLHNDCDPAGKAAADAADLQSLHNHVRLEQCREHDAALVEDALAHYVPQAASVCWGSVPALLRRIPHLPSADELKAVLAALAGIVVAVEASNHHITGYDDVCALIDAAHDAVDLTVNTWGQES